MTDTSLDALLPAAMAARAEQVGVTKANLPPRRLIPLGILAGAFIALGANFATVVTAGGGSAPGVTRLLGGVVFSLGLILVVVSGAELFTGNTLIVMAFAGRKVTAAKFVRNWLVVYISNFVGAIATAALVVWSGQLKAIASAVLANCLVCLAVWMTLSARTLVDKIVVIVPSIAAFVAAGFLLDNLIPVTIGNIIGGALLVGLVYWFVYLRGRAETEASTIESDR